MCCRADVTLVLPRFVVRDQAPRLCTSSAATVDSVFAEVGAPAGVGVALIIATFETWPDVVSRAMTMNSPDSAMLLGKCRDVWMMTVTLSVAFIVMRPAARV